MKLAFKKAHGWFTISRAIALFSGGSFCHVELVFSDGVSFSSTSLDGDPKGVRFKQINYSHPDEWVFVDLMPPFAWLVEEKSRACAQRLCGKPYDYKGVFRFILPFMREHPKAYFCSEACLEVLQAGGMFKGVKPWKVSPNKLYEMVTK